MDIYVDLLPEIVENLTQIDDVLDCLQSGKHITTRNRETIKSNASESDKIRKMLEILKQRKCSPKTFSDILSKTGNEHLENLFRKQMGENIVPVKTMPRETNNEQSTKLSQKEIGKEPVQETRMPQKIDKRKIIILEGFDQDDKLHSYFKESHPDCEVTYVLGPLNRIGDQIASIPENKYRYFDIIVLSNKESLQTMLSYIKNKMLPKFPPSIITFLIIVDEKNDNGTECQPPNKIDLPDARPVNRNDIQESQHVIASLKREFWNGFLDDFIKSKEMLNIFIDKKPIEETPDERKIFILERSEQDKILHNYFQESHPDYEVTFVLGTLNRIGDEIAKIPENTCRYFDIIVLSNNESLQTMLSYIKDEMLPRIQTSIITFLIIVDEKNDNGTECQPLNKIDFPDSRALLEFHSLNRNDLQESQLVIASLKREFWNGVLDDFIKSKEMLNIFIRKADTRKHLRLHVY